MNPKDFWKRVYLDAAVRLLAHFTPEELDQWMAAHIDNSCPHPRVAIQEEVGALKDGDKVHLCCLICGVRWATFVVDEGTNVWSISGEDQQVLVLQGKGVKA